MRFLSPSAGPILFGLLTTLTIALLTQALTQTPAAALVCAGAQLGEPVRSLAVTGDIGLALTESGSLYALKVTRSGLEVDPVQGDTLPPDSSLVHVVASRSSFGFTAVRTTADSLVVYRGVASHEGSGFVATVHKSVIRFDELSERLRSGEWRILELAGPVGDSSGDLYIAALLESIDGDFVVEVWDVFRRRVLAEFPATELVKLSLRGRSLMVACEEDVEVVPLDNGPPSRIRIFGEVLDLAGNWVLYRAWDGYHVAEISGARLARDFKLPGAATRVALYEPMGYVLAWSGNKVYVVDARSNRFAAVIDAPGKIQLIEPPFIIYGDRIGMLYLEKIWLYHEAALTYDIFIVDNEAKAIYRVCNSRELICKDMLKKIPERIYPPYPVEFHPNTVGVVVAYWLNGLYYICCSDERTKQTLTELLRYPEVRRTFDTLNAKITTRAVSDPKRPAFKIYKEFNKVVFKFEDLSDFDYNDAIVCVPLLPTGVMILKQIMYGKDWVLLEIIPPERGYVSQVVVNGRQVEFYVIPSDKTISGPYWWYWVGDQRVLILVKGLKEERGTIRVDFKSVWGTKFSKVVRYALPRVCIKRVSYQILLYDANRDELLTRVRARFLIRNTIARMVGIAVLDGDGNLITYKVYRKQYPPGEYTISEEFRLRPPKRGPLKVIFLIEYDGDLVIASDRKFVLRAEPEQAELLVPYARPGRLTAHVLDYGLNWIELRVESEEPGTLHIEDVRDHSIPFYVLEGGRLLSGPYGDKHPLKLGTAPVILVLRELEPGRLYRFRLVRKSGILTVFEVECALPKADLKVELLGGSIEGRSLTLAFSVQGFAVNSVFRELDLTLREGSRALWHKRIALDDSKRFNLPIRATASVGHEKGTLILEVVARYDHDTILPESGEFRIIEAPARRVLKVAYGRPHVEIADYGLNWLLLRVIPWRPGNLIVQVKGRPVTYYVRRGGMFEEHSASYPYHAEGFGAVEILLYNLEKRGTVEVTNESGGFSSTTSMDYQLPQGVRVTAEMVHGRYLVDQGELALDARVLVKSIDTTVRRIVLRVLDDSGEVLKEVARSANLRPGTHELTFPVKVHVHRKCGRLRLQVLAEFDHGTIVRDPREGPIPCPAHLTIDVPYSAPRVRVVDCGINWLLLELTTREGGELIVRVNGRKAWYFLAKSKCGGLSGPYDLACVGRNSTVFVLVPGVPLKGKVSVVLAGRLERVRSVGYELPNVVGRVSIRNVSANGGKIIAEAHLWLEVHGTVVRRVDVSVIGAKSWSVNAFEGNERLDLSDVRLGEGVHMVRLLFEFTPENPSGTIRVVLGAHYEGDTVFDSERRKFVESPLILTMNVPYVLPQPPQQLRERTKQEPVPTRPQPLRSTAKGTKSTLGRRVARRSYTSDLDSLVGAFEKALRSALTELLGWLKDMLAGPSTQQPVKQSFTITKMGTSECDKQRPRVKPASSAKHRSGTAKSTIPGRTSSLNPVKAKAIEIGAAAPPTGPSAQSRASRQERSITPVTENKPVKLHEKLPPARVRLVVESCTTPLGIKRLIRRTFGHALRRRGAPTQSGKPVGLPPTGVSLLAILLSVFSALSGLYLTCKSIVHR